MFPGIEDWIEKLGLSLLSAIAAAGFIRKLYWDYLSRITEELKDRNSLEFYKEDLEEPRIARRYRKILDLALRKADSFFGENPLGWPALSRCLLIAFIYPLGIFILVWFLGGPHSIGTLELLPAAVGFPIRLGFLAASGLFCLGVYWLIKHYERIEWWHEKIFSGVNELLPLTSVFKKPVIQGSLLSLLVFLLVLIGTDSIPRSVAGAFAGALAFIFARAVVTSGAATLAFIIAGSGATTVAIAGSMSGATVGSFAGVGFFAVGGVFAISGVFSKAIPESGAFHTAVAGSVILGIVVAVVAAIGTYLFNDWAAVFHPDNLSVILFLVLLPVLNGLLDFVSWAVSRSLGRALQRHFGKYSALLLAFVDIVAAVLFLCTLAVVLTATVESLNALAIAKTGVEAIDVAQMLTQAAAHPFSTDGFWITAMLFSTLIPTVLHLSFAVASVFALRARPAKRKVWVDEIDKVLASMYPYEVLPLRMCREITNYYFWHRWFGASILTIILMILVIWGWSTFVGDISDTLLGLAEWSRDWVRGG